MRLIGLALVVVLSGCPSTSSSGGGGGSAVGGGSAIGGGSATGGGAAAGGGSSGGGSASGGGVAAGGGAGGGGGVTPLTVDQYCAQFAKASCPYLVACGYYTSAVPCEAFYGSIDYCQAARAALHDGRVVFNGMLAAQCVAAQQARTTCNIPTSQGGPDCTRVFDGQLTSGQMCLEDSDCVSGLFCSSQPAVSCGGTCQPKKALGDPATRWGECQDNLGFDSGHCVAQVPVGSMCSSTAQRECELPSLCANGTCLAYRTVGQSCTSYECWFSSCVSGTCVAYGGNGATCGQGMPPCAADLTCLSGHCQPHSGPSGPCSIWADCQSGLYCSGSGTCVAKKVAQSPCAAWWECGDGLYCDSAQSLCLPLKPVGASCANAAECQTSCNLNACWTPSCPSGVCTPAFCVDPTP